MFNTPFMYSIQNLLFFFAAMITFFIIPYFSALIYPNRPDPA